MDVDLRIEGADELEAKLQLLGEKFGNAALYGALYDAAKPLADEVKRTAPVAKESYYRYSKGRRGGEGSRVLVRPKTLRKSVKRARIKNMDVAAVTGRFCSAAVFSPFFVKSTAKMAARPFVRPAFDKKQAECVDSFADKLRKRIQAIAAKQNIDLESTTDDEG